MKDTQETQVQWLGWEDPLERKWQPTPVLLSGKSHGQRSLGSYSLCKNKELNSTERIFLKFLASLHGLQHPWPGNESSPQQWTCRVFTTGLPRNSLKLQTFNLKFLWVRILGGVLQKPKLGGSHLEVSAGCSQCTGCGWGSLKTWLELEDLAPRWLIHMAVDRGPQILMVGAFLRYF